MFKCWVRVSIRMEGLGPFKRIKILALSSFGPFINIISEIRLFKNFPLEKLKNEQKL